MNKRILIFVVSLIVIVATFGDDQKNSEQELKNIPTELQSQANEVFARGKSIFIWDTENGTPLELASNCPVGLRQIGYAFAPTGTVTRFTVAAAVIRRDANGQLSRTTVVRPGPDKRSRLGVAQCIVSVFTAEEVSQAIGLNLAHGEGKATFAIVPFGTKPDEAQKTVLSNEIIVPVKIK